MAGINKSLDRFYTLLARLEAVPRQGQRLDEQSGRSRWPDRGVYFFREPGELRAGPPQIPRVVRVGTHAVSKGSRTRLWGRLRNHRGGIAGGGSHRCSVFRLHVGAAILAGEGESLPTWGKRSSASRFARDAEATLERRVSGYIGAMSVLWIDVPGEAGRDSQRSFIERNAIALLSNHLSPADRPSCGWLGSSSPHEDIRRSALWNLDYVDDDCDPKFLEVLEECVVRTSDQYCAP